MGALLVHTVQWLGDRRLQIAQLFLEKLKLPIIMPHVASLTGYLTEFVELLEKQEKAKATDVQNSVPGQQDTR